MNEYLTDLQCVWFRTMKENSEGKGTSFNLKQLTDNQKKCYYCSGLETQLDCYFGQQDPKKS